MNTNVTRAIAAIVFIIGLAVAYTIGKQSGEREATAKQVEKGNSSGDKSNPLSAIDNATRTSAGGEENPAGRKPASVKSIIAKARTKMRGGMMNPAGMMRALSMLDGITDDQIQEALAEVEATVTEPQQKMMFAMMLLSRWAEKDGPAAMDYADEHFASKNPMMMGIKNGLVTSWAQNDPEGAWEWYQNQEDDGRSGAFGGRSMALMGIIGSLAQTDVDLAFERLASLEDEEKPMAYQGLGQAIWDENKRGEILAKIQAVEDDAQRVAMRGSVINQWAMMDTDGALEWAESLEGKDRSATVRQIGQALAWSDPNRSGELMLSVAETPKEREEAYVNAIRSWAHQDPNGAGEWLGKQEQGPELNRARKQFAMNIVQKDPESAMAWANAVTDESGREDGIRQVYMTWQGKDKEAADAGLESTELSPEKIAEIQAMRPPAAGKAQDIQLDGPIESVE